LVLWGFNTVLDDPLGEATTLQLLFSALGGSSWADTLTQYGVTNAGGQLKGVWFDNAPVSIVQAALPDAFLAQEAVRASEHFGYAADANYVIATPHLRRTAEFGVLSCASHSAVTDRLGRSVAYTNFPYVADAGPLCGPGGLDSVTIQASREYANVITDPIPPTGWTSPSGQEVGSICPGTDVVGSFKVQQLWSDATSSCV
jgi:hypothetical protein